MTPSPSFEGSRKGEKLNGCASQRSVRMEAAVRSFLSALGEDTDREGLLDTPKRVVKAIRDQTAGYAGESGSAVLRSAVFHESLVGKRAGGVVLVHDIDFASLSVVDLMPFHGRCHVAYIPSDGVVVGLSKLARLTKLHSRQLQTPRSLARAVMRDLEAVLSPAGVCVVLEYVHVSDLRPRACGSACGAFAEPSSTALSEFMRLLQMSGRTACMTGVCTSSTGSSSSSCTCLDVGSESSWVSLASRGESGGTGQQAPASRSGEALDREVSSSGRTWPPDSQAQLTDSIHSMMELALPECLYSDTTVVRGAAQRYADFMMAANSGRWMTLDRILADARSADRDAERCTWGIDELCLSSLTVAGDDSESPADSDAEDDMDVGDRGDATAAEAACSRGGEQAGTSDCWILMAPGQQQQQQQPQLPSFSWAPGAAEAGTGAEAMMLADIPFQSLCEHHMLPFQGRVKLACRFSVSADWQHSPPGFLQRACVGIVAMHTRRLQIQERITHQVAAALLQLPGCCGAIVVCDAAHLCMVARGVEMHASSTLTNSASGCFQDDAALRLAAMQQLSSL